MPPSTDRTKISERVYRRPGQKAWLGIVDGTSDDWSNRDEENARQYDVDFRNSFCRQLGNNGSCLKDYETLYLRGPTNKGFENAGIIDRITNEIESKPDDIDIILCGYSRGASAVVGAAIQNNNSKARRRITGMILFDPVDRRIGMYTTTIPDNVASAVIISRDLSENAKDLFQRKYDRFFSPGGRWIGNPIRTWMGKTATEPEDPERLKRYQVLGSHGAMGGVGWINVEEDKDAQTQCARYANEYITALQLSDKLHIRSISRPGRLTASSVDRAKDYVYNSYASKRTAIIRSVEDAFSYGRDAQDNERLRTSSVGRSVRDRVLDGIWPSED